jgi:lipase chaperone LimK
MRKFLSGAVLIIIAVVIYYVVWPGSPDMSNDSAGRAASFGFASSREYPSSDVSSLPAGVQNPAVPEAASGVRMPPSQFKNLRGTSVPDGLRVDAGGNLICDEDLRLLFDYFLLAKNSVDEADFEQIVEEWIRQNTGEKAAADALDLWGRYLEYLKALGADPGATLADTRQTKPTDDYLESFERAIEARSRLQKKWLPEVEESWFSADNDYDRESLALLRKRLASGYTPEPIKVEVNQVWEKERNPEYEKRLEQLRQASDLNARDLRLHEEALRREYYPERDAYIRQSLRDLSR